MYQCQLGLGKPLVLYNGICHPNCRRAFEATYIGHIVDNLHPIKLECEDVKDAMACMGRKVGAYGYFYVKHLFSIIVDFFPGDVHCWMDV